MHDVTDISRIHELLQHEFSLDSEGASTTMDELLYAIAQRVAQLLEQDAGLLFSYLYRLDVPESDVQKVMNPTWKEPADLSLARLILNRQLQRLHTKKTIIQRPIEGWEW